MDPVRVALVAAAVPAAAAAVVLLLTRGRPFGLATALAAGTIAGHVALAGAPVFPPLEAWKWIPWIALAAVLAAVASGSARGRALRWAAPAALCVFAAWASLIERTAPWIAGATAGIVLLAVLLAIPARRLPPTTFPLTVAIVASAAAAALVISGTAVVGQACGALAAAAGACFVVGLRWPAPARSAAAPVAALLGAFLLNGAIFAEMPWTVVALLAAAPVGAWIPDRVVGRDPRPWQILAIRGVAVAAICGAAVALAVQASPPLDY